MIRTPMPQAIPDDSQLLTRALKAGNRLFSRNLHRVRMLSPCTVPATGPAIVICNHISGLDPFLVQGTCPRVIRWMMAREYFDLPIVKTLCSAIGFIPVTRSGRDSTSLKAALRTLDAGHALGIFPEGRIATGHALLPFQPGLGVIASRTGATVYPVALEGLRRNQSMLNVLLVPQEAKIIYGSPLPPQREPIDPSQFWTAVQTLKRQALAAN